MLIKKQNKAHVEFLIGEKMSFLKNLAIFLWAVICAVCIGVNLVVPYLGICLVGTTLVASAFQFLAVVSPGTLSVILFPELLVNAYIIGFIYVLGVLAFEAFFRVNSGLRGLSVSSARAYRFGIVGTATLWPLLLFYLEDDNTPCTTKGETQ